MGYQSKQETEDWKFVVDMVLNGQSIEDVDELRTLRSLGMILGHAAEKREELPDPMSTAGEALSNLWAWFEMNRPDLIYCGG